MNKKFEYVDDNPGSYFGMLVESVEDKKELNESVVGNAKNWLIDKEGKSPKEAEKIINSLSPEEIEKIALKWTKQGKLKEAKFVPQDKMSKKSQKELNDKKRGTWGDTNPVTKVQPNKKAYDRKRDSKAIEEDFDNDVVTLVNLLSDKYCDEDGNVSKDSYDSIYNYLGKNYSEKVRDAVMDNLVTEFGLPAEYLRKRNKKVVDESLTEDSEVFKDMSNALDDIEYLCNDTYNWGIDEWNDKNNVKNTAERIIDSANVLLDSIKKY